jgi:hypothetical protein
MPSRSELEAARTREESAVIVHSKHLVRFQFQLPMISRRSDELPYLMADG